MVRWHLLGLEKFKLGFMFEGQNGEWKKKEARITPNIYVKMEVVCSDRRLVENVISWKAHEPLNAVLSMAVLWHVEKRDAQLTE